MMTKNEYVNKVELKDEVVKSREVRDKAEYADKIEFDGNDC